MAVQIYARVADRIVVELWPHDLAAPMPEPQPTPVEAFGKDLGEQFVACDETVCQGWTYDGKAFAAPVVVVPPTPVREAVGYLLISALTDVQVTALATAKAKDQRLLSARVDPWPEDNPKIARIADKLGITPAAWFDAALAPAAG